MQRPPNQVYFFGWDDPKEKIINTQTIASEEGHYEFVFQRKLRVGRITYKSHNVTHEKCTDQQALLRSK